MINRMSVNVDNATVEKKKTNVTGINIRLISPSISTLRVRWNEGVLSRAHDGKPLKSCIPRES